MGIDVGGAAVGAAFNELFAAVREVVQTIKAFGLQLKKIENTLGRIEPIIRDWDEFNNRLDRNPKEMRPIKELLNKGKGLVQKCLSIYQCNMRKKYTHSKKLKAFNAELLGDFDLYIDLLDARNNGETLYEVREMRTEFNRLIRSGKAKSVVLQSGFGASGNLAVPDAPDFVVGSVVEALRKLREQLLEEGLSVIVVTAPGGCGKTTLLKSLVENSTAWRESDVQDGVHPLPRPPGAALPSHSPHNAQVTVKTESLPLKSQWQKGRLLGRGTFGGVYVASNRETGALCAMKEVELLPDDPKSAECTRQLEQEIKVLSRLKHQNIVQYYGSEIVEDRFYIYLEYVHPGSINKYVRDHRMAITESVVCNFTRHILSGLAYLHSQKTIHRDIKGANLLVDASGIVKLADFGMAKHLTGQKIDLSLKGSPYWMAPELLQAKIQKDNSSDHALAVDIWSLGCTIVEMLTGRPPWSEFEGVAAMFKALNNSPSIPETLSSEGKDFLQCCFRRNPAERPSAAKLLEHPFLKSSQQIDFSPHTRA